MTKKEDREKQDKAQHIKDATKLLTSLPTLKRNISGGRSPWKEVIAYRIQCVDEFIEYLKTGKTDHIIIDHGQPQKEIQHFK